MINNYHYNPNIRKRFSVIIINIQTRVSRHLRHVSGNWLWSGLAMVNCATLRYCCHTYHLLLLIKCNWNPALLSTHFHENISSRNLICKQKITVSTSVAIGWKREASFGRTTFGFVNLRRKRNSHFLQLFLSRNRKVLLTFGPVRGRNLLAYKKIVSCLFTHEAHRSSYELV